MDTLPGARRLAPFLNSVSHAMAHSSCLRRCLAPRLPTLVRGSEPQEMHHGRPDLSRRRAPRISRQHHRSRHREGHLALARQAHGRDGARRRARRSHRPDREGRQDRVRLARGPARARADPPRCRACAGRGGADAVARHAGHHRPGDRERLLLRLLPQRAVHAGRLPGDREEDARDHRARQTLHQGGLGRARRPSRCSATRARASRSSWSTRSPATSRSRSTTRATGSTSAAART